LQTHELVLWYTKAKTTDFVWNIEEQYSDEKRPWNVYKKGGEMVNKSEYKRLTNVWTDINEVGYGESLTASADIQSTEFMEVPKAGTYYLKIKSYDTADVTYSVQANIVSSNDDSLAAKDPKYISILGSEDSNCYKINVKKTGIIDVYLVDMDDNISEDVKVEICKKTDGKTKVITSRDSLKYGTTFGLAKGTYYIRVSSYSKNVYLMGYESKSVSDKSGSKKSNAGTIKWKGKSSGLILATDKTSKADWFKFYNSKTRKVKITIEGNVTGDVILEFYGSDGRKFSGSLNIDEYYHTSYANVSSTSYYSSSETLPRGTYYIKVTKGGKDVSGNYTVKIS
jgi:hypothetical protein